MAHEINSMMFAGQTPWHGLGKFVGNQDITSKQAIEAAGLDWKVHTIPLMRTNPLTGGQEPSKLHSLHRMDTGLAIAEGMTEEYVPVQNGEAFEFLDSLAKEGEVKYHTAGALGKGERIWLLAQLPDEAYIAGRDRVGSFVLLSNSHDGKNSLVIQPTSVRVVCANTLGMALRDGNKKLRVRHTGDLKDKVSDARTALGLVSQEFKRFADFAEALSAIKFGVDEMNWMVGEILGPRPDEKEAPKGATIYDNKVSRILNNYRSGRGQRDPAVAGTAWAALNGVTEFMNYDEGRVKQDRRLEKLWSQNNESLGYKAMAVLSSMYSLDYTKDESQHQRVSAA